MTVTPKYMLLGGRSIAPRKGRLDRSDKPAAATRERAPMPFELTDAERRDADRWLDVLDARMQANLDDSARTAAFKAWLRAWQKAQKKNGQPEVPDAAA